MADEKQKAAFTRVQYNSMTTEKPGFEHPSDPKPMTRDALQARARAIREGRLDAPARDTLKRAAEADARAKLAEAEAKMVEAEAKKSKRKKTSE